METFDIIKTDFDGNDEEARRMYLALSDLVKKNPDFRVIRSNNSLFCYINFRNGNVQILIFSADDDETLPDTMHDFCAAMKFAGFKTGAFDVIDDNGKFVDASKKAGLNINIYTADQLYPGDNPKINVAVLEF